MLTGVCNGLAAPFNIDVTIVRVVFVALALLTKGGWVIVYVALSFFIPFANTAEERAAAHGVTFSAQDREFVHQLPTIGRDVWQSLTQR